MKKIINLQHCVTIGHLSIIMIGLLLLVSSVSASDDWWNTSYQYRVPITLTGNTSGSQTNYQLMLNVSYTPNIQPDFDDIRFTNSSGNLLSAWLEDKIDDSWADIWVNFTNTPADGETKTYYMYYGNSEVSDYWNGTNTFNYYEDFENYNVGSDLNGQGGWTGSQTHIISDDVSYTNSKCAKGADNDKMDYHSCPLTDTGVITVHLRNTATSALGYLYIGDSGNSQQLIISLFNDGHIKYNDGGGNWANLPIDTTYNADEWYKLEFTYDATNNKYPFIKVNGDTKGTNLDSVSLSSASYLGIRTYTAISYYDDVYIRKYASSPPSYGFGSEEEYTLPAASETPTPTPTPTPLEEITSSNYVIQNQTLYITKPCDLQYKITSNSFVYGGLRNINTVICDNNNTVISGWFKISTDQAYDADYTFFINVNDTSYESKIITIKQEQVDSSIISKTYKRTLLMDGYEIYSYNTTVYIISIIPNPIYFYFNLEDRTIQFGDKQFNNQTLVFNQLNFDDQYEFMNNASSDTVVMKFKAINPSIKSGAELKGLTGILLNTLSKIPFVGKSLKNILYYPLFFIQTIFDFVFTFLDIIVNDWWYGLMLMEIVCIFVASKNKSFTNVMQAYVDTHIKIIKFIYEWIILKTINLIITIVVTVKDMIKWW